MSLKVVLHIPFGDIVGRCIVAIVAIANTPLKLLGGFFSAFITVIGSFFTDESKSPVGSSSASRWKCCKAAISLD